WRLYRNPSAAGLALLEDAAVPVAISSQVHSNHRFEVVVDSWLGEERRRPNRTEAGETQEKRLIVSRLAQPGWQARIANRQVAIEPRDGLMSLRVPAGQRVKIEFSYFPPGLREGLLVSGATVIVILVLAAPGSRRTRPGQELTALSPACTA
ncbi:MAG: YfhO family protein, partial [Phycisphaerae bacterium]|nr:YfhO family protein [Phycisphaerae bacterium]